MNKRKRIVTLVNLFLVLSFFVTTICYAGSVDASFASIENTPSHSESENLGDTSIAEPISPNVITEEDYDPSEDQEETITVTSDSYEASLPNNRPPTTLTSAEEVMMHYMSCLYSNDYEGVIRASVNHPYSEEAVAAWASYSSYGAAVPICVTDNRALYSVGIPFTDPGTTGLPSFSHNRGEILRFLYVVKYGDYWYIDGPLHNDLPSDDWWAGDTYTWEVGDYGFSDSQSTPGITTYSQEEFDYWRSIYEQYSIDLGFGTIWRDGDWFITDSP